MSGKRRIFGVSVKYCLIDVKYMADGHLTSLFTISSGFSSKKGRKSALISHPQIGNHWNSNDREHYHPITNHKLNATLSLGLKRPRATYRSKMSKHGCSFSPADSEASGRPK